MFFLLIYLLFRHVPASGEFVAIYVNDILRQIGTFVDLESEYGKGENVKQRPRFLA